MRGHTFLLLGLSGLLSFASGCNALFGIDPGHSETGGGAGTTETGGTGGTGGTTETTGGGGTTTTGGGGTMTTGGGGTGGSPTCTPNTATCDGAVLHACDAEGFPKPDVTCDAVAGCDALAGKCVDKDAMGRLAVGRARGCAIEDDRSVRCWGVRGGGAIFADPPLVQGSAVEVPGVVARQISAGVDQQCALQDDGSVVCWGANDWGQLGYPAGNGQTPQTVPNLPVALEVAAGPWCTCARLADGTVDCWGALEDGCLGTAPAMPGSQPVPTPVPGVTDVVELRLGIPESPYCARQAAGGVICWSDKIAPKAIPGVDDAVSIAVGYRHVLIRSQSKGLLVSSATDDGLDWRPATTYVAGTYTAMAAGYGLVLRKGDGTLVEAAFNYDPQPPLPVSVPGLPQGDVAELAEGQGFDYGTRTRCLRLAGVPMAAAVYCWGDDQFGALGAGALEYYRTPQDVPGIATATSLSTSQMSTTAVLADGSVRFWGYAPGLSFDDSASPVQALLLGEDNTAVTTVDHWAQAYALKTSSGPWLFDHAAPAIGGNLLASGYTDFVDMHGYGHFDIGLRAGGTVVVYMPYDDSNVDGILGDGTLTTTAGTTATVPGITNAVAVAAYGEDYNPTPSHACALLAPAGTVSCWGHNYAGEIGIGSMGDPVPAPALVAIPNNEAVVSIAAGAYFHCAAVASGKVYCWGSGNSGELGVPGVTLAKAPLLPVSGISTAVAVTARQQHACALLANKTVKCWGANDFGQLGSGDLVDSALPLPVSGLTNVAEVSAGSDHTCARRSDGTVACWGSSYTGQVGTGVNGTFASPLQVTGL